jgi:hypothetical protein
LITSHFYFKKTPQRTAKQQNLKDKFFTGGEKNFRTAPGVKLGNLYKAKIFVSESLHKNKKSAQSSAEDERFLYSLE